MTWHVDDSAEQKIAELSALTPSGELTPRLANEIVELWPWIEAASTLHRTPDTVRRINALQREIDLLRAAKKRNAALKAGEEPSTRWIGSYRRQERLNG
jgi:hypothetical protein